MSNLSEGKRRNRLHYRSGRREALGFDTKLPGKKRKTKRRRKGRERLLARTDFASKTRWKKT